MPINRLSYWRPQEEWGTDESPHAVKRNNQEDKVKKLWQAMLITALAGMAINSYADVQNIRLSGDIRIRGYYTVNTDGDSDEDQVNNTDSYISQRTRVTVEADLEDHVLVVVTLKAEGLW